MPSPSRRFGERLVDLALIVGVSIWAHAVARNLVVEVGQPGAAIAAVAMALPILLTGAIRRRDPLPVFLVLLICHLILWATVRSSLAGYPALAAVFVAQAYEPVRSRRLPMAILAGVLAVGDPLLSDGWTIAAEDLVLAAEELILVVAMIAWGWGVSSSRLYRESLVERAEDAERERDLRAAQAVAEERARIARDIHDVVSHSLAVVVVQAAGAQRVADRDPDRAKEALGVIADTARGALTEMRAMLQVLRSGDAEPTPGEPSPGLPQIDTLAEELTSRGLPVAVTTSGTPFRLSPGAELALYRVIQESLTNALKHGDRTSATRLSISYEPESLKVVVVNARGAPDETRSQELVPGSGSGQTGMRERLELYGGDLDIGSTASEYWVRATVPRADPRGGAPSRPTEGQR